MDSIVLRDIVFRHKVRDVVLLERLIHFLIDSVGSLFSINSVVGALHMPDTAPTGKRSEPI